jgi:hypothetical protein
MSETEWPEPAEPPEVEPSEPWAPAEDEPSEGGDAD